MALFISRQQLNALQRHGEATYPHECCGLLLGRPAPGAELNGSRVALEAFPLRNANVASPENRFEFDPKEHIQAQRAARDRGLEVVGFYHSHPDHPAWPSQYDLDHASWPGYSYLIVSISQGRAADQNSFELAHDRSRFLPEPIELLAESAVAASPAASVSPATPSHPQEVKISRNAG